MNNTALQIEPLDIRNADREAYVALNAFNNRIRAESYPDDPPIALAEMIQQMLHIPGFVDVFTWVIWDETHSSLIGKGEMSVLRMETNQHVADISIQVVPEYRRQGLGQHFLNLVAKQAQHEQRRLLMTSTNERIPGGAAFMTRIGAQKGQESHLNQLTVADLDRNLLQQWLAHGEQLTEDFELGLWDGAFPEERLPAVVDLLNVMNSAPRDQLDVEDFKMTPERLREMEKAVAARQTEHWTLYVAERKTGKFVGFTDVLWNANRPQLLTQNSTGIFPEYRNRGLGRWLKAAMLDKVLRERPQVKFVRTGNADSNTAMLKINHELGFKPYLSTAVWQVETDQVIHYLDQKRGNHDV